MAAGFILFVGLSFCALLAGTQVARRGAFEGQAERLLVVFMLFSAIILVPIHALGLTNTLTRPNLALASLATSLAVFAAASGRAWRAELVGSFRELRGFC